MITCHHTHWLLLLFAGSAFATAWQLESTASLRFLKTRPGPFDTYSADIRKFKRRNLKEFEQHEDEPNVDSPDIDEKRLIQISSEVKLPFSPEVAFDAYSDLTRQPSWSHWLHSVEYLDNDKKNSKWTMQFLKIKYSWTAVALKNERPHVIQWKSTSGLQNSGMVTFIPNDDMEYPTLMRMKMAFVAPRAAAAVFRRSKVIAEFVREKMILDSMLKFGNVVKNGDGGSIDGLKNA